MEIGYGSQCWKLDGTPIGMVSLAAVFSSSDLPVPSLKRAHSWSNRAATRVLETGVDVAGIDLNVCG